jgi:hypothetical protein
MHKEGTHYPGVLLPFPLSSPMNGHQAFFMTYIVSFSFREPRIPEAQFPRRTLLGSPVNKRVATVHSGTAHVCGRMNGDSAWLLGTLVSGNPGWRQADLPTQRFSKHPFCRRASETFRGCIHPASSPPVLALCCWEKVAAIYPYSGTARELHPLRFFISVDRD